jgi:hypothetical protein
MIVMLPNMASSKVVVAAFHHRVMVAGSDHTITPDCPGGSARIAGSHNDVTLTGGCKRLSIYGAWNKVTVAFATGARIRFIGAGNEVIWTTPDGKQTTALPLGVDNALKPASVQ